MSYEEDHGYEVFGQNLFMAATDAATQPKWIITSPKKLKKRCQAGKRYLRHLQEER